MTYRFVPSVVIPVGLANFAEVPVASVDPYELPARVVTAVERLNSVPWMDPPSCDLGYPNVEVHAGSNL